MNFKKISLLALTACAFVSAPALADNDWDDDDHRPRAAKVQQKHTAAPKISRERAVAIAKQRFKGARVTDVDLEHGAYQIDLKDHRYEYEVWVDARSGKIIRTKKELDD